MVKCWYISNKHNQFNNEDYKVKENKIMTREKKMNKRREAGKAYKYKPNPFPKGSDEYREEQWNRAHKNISHKTPLARWTSIMAKLDNQLEAEKKIAKDKKEVKNNKKS